MVGKGGEGMKLTLRLHVRCTSCFSDRMININFYQPSGKIEWETFKCDNCGFDEFFAMPYFKSEKEEKG